MNFPLRRIAFRVEYDGTEMHGWQAQPSGVPTVQQGLESAIESILGFAVDVQGASRTDAGVHALDQLAAVTLAHPIRPSGLCKGVNRRLRPRIAIRDAREVSLDFNPRFANRGKIYRYRFYQGRAPRPMADRHAWRVPWPFDPQRIERAAADLVGEHDFTSFAARDGGHRHAVRTIRRVELTAGDDGILTLRVEGTGFLKHMVRNIVGTLIGIGRARFPVDAIPTMLAARDRSAAGVTAPPQGLCLERMLVDERAFAMVGIGSADGAGQGAGLADKP